jgi:hypothetical protein
MNIAPETVEKATKCPHNRVCLSVGGKPCCKIECTVNDIVFFTQEKTSTGCPYQASFGYSFMCTCPVRQEIFLKHRV